MSESSGVGLHLGGIDAETSFEDLRARVIEAIEGGSSCRESAD
jgi:hypothetical protein